jgi:hypothetical protein
MILRLNIQTYENNEQHCSNLDSFSISRTQCRSIQVSYQFTGGICTSLDHSPCWSWPLVRPSCTLQEALQLLSTVGNTST